MMKIISCLFIVTINVFSIYALIKCFVEDIYPKVKGNIPKIVGISVILLIFLFPFEFITCKYMFDMFNMLRGYL